MLPYRAPLSPGQSPGGGPHPVLASRAPLQPCRARHLAKGQRRQGAGIASLRLAISSISPGLPSQQSRPIRNYCLVAGAWTTLSPGVFVLLTTKDIQTRVYCDANDRISEQVELILAFQDINESPRSVLNTSLHSNNICFFFLHNFLH